MTDQPQTNTSEQDELQVQRQRIDRVDQTITALLYERLRLESEVDRLTRAQPRTTPVVDGTHD